MVCSSQQEKHRPFYSSVRYHRKVLSNCFPLAFSDKNSKNEGRQAIFQGIPRFHSKLELTGISELIKLEVEETELQIKIVENFIDDCYWN